MIRILSTVLCLMPAVALAQDATRLSGPVTGIIFDAKSHALRPMVGVPGASYLGDALVSGLDAAAVSPDGSRALAVADGRLSLITGLREGAAQSAVLDGAIPAVDRIAWSPDGAFAGVYCSSAGSAQLIREAAGNPAPGAAADVPFPVNALAVGMNGELIAGADGGVYLLSPGAAPRLLAPMTSVVALAVRGTSLYAADTGAGQVWLIENYAGGASASIFLDSIDAPVGIAISADGRRLLAASRKAKTVAVLDTASHAPLRSLNLDIAPAELTGFGGRDVWLLNNSSGADPIYIATGGDEPAAWFVPAGRGQ